MRKTWQDPMDDTQQLETRRRIKVCLEALIKELKSRGLSVKREDENTLVINGMTFTATDQLSDTYNDVCYLLTDYNQTVECTLSRMTECADTIEEILDVQVEKMAEKKLRKLNIRRVNYGSATIGDDFQPRYGEDVFEVPDELRLSYYDGDQRKEVVLLPKDGLSNVWYQPAETPIRLRSIDAKMSVNAYTTDRECRELKFSAFVDSDYGNVSYEGYTTIDNLKPFEEAIDHAINDAGLPTGGFHHIGGDEMYPHYSDFKYNSEEDLYQDYYRASIGKSTFSEAVKKQRDKNNGLRKGRTTDEYVDSLDKCNEFVREFYPVADRELGVHIEMYATKSGFPETLNKIFISFEGDWKHQHWYFEDVVDDFCRSKGLEYTLRRVKEEDSGSDWYWAEYMLIVGMDFGKLFG